MNIAIQTVVAIAGLAIVAFITLLLWGASACQDDPEDDYQ